MNATKSHLRPLTTLRFLAAFHVVAYHVAGHQPPYTYFKESPTWVHNFISSGFVGVSLFFILSGFILSYNYLEPGPESRIEPAKFWKARFARIYPVYFLGLLISLPLFLRDLDRADTGLGPALFVATTTLGLVQSLYPFLWPAWNALGWSLSCEAFFYLLFPFLGRPLARMDARGIGRVMAAMYACIAIPPLIFQFYHPGGVAGLDAQTRAVWDWAILGNPLARLPEFVLGAAAGRLFLLRRESRTSPFWISTLTPMMAVAIFVALTSALDPDRAHMLYGPLLNPLFLAVIYTLAAGVGPIAKFMSLGLGVLLGEASYALYITHATLADAYILIKQRLTSSTDWGDWNFWACSGLIVLISIFIFKEFENPMRRFLRRKLAGEPAVAKAET